MKSQLGVSLLAMACASAAGNAIGSYGTYESQIRVAIEPLKQQHLDLIARKGYEAVERADPAHLIEFLVAVKQTNLDKLQETLLNVSDPASPSYANFLSQRAVHDLIAPARQSVDAVMRWLEEHGAVGESVTPNSDFIRATVSVAQAEKLVAAEYWTYKHLPTGTLVTRIAAANATAAPYTLPPTVAPHVDVVMPALTFPPVPHLTKNVGKTPKIIPSKLKQLYNITDVGGGANSSVVQAIASFIKQYYSEADLKAFWNKYSIKHDQTWTDVPESQKHSPIGTEASLDVQWISVSGEEVNTENWSTEGVQPGNAENEPFVTWLYKVSNTSSPPSLFSISYGDEETGVSEAYALRAGVEFQKAGVRGITLLVASGDNGVGCALGSFVPTFPASCPWLTAVGGVTDGTPGSSPTNEVVADLSGGGFSNYFGRPSFQDAAVTAYQKGSGLPRADQWNASGAGFPDIAAQAIDFDTCTENFFYPISGTSCACPAAAGIVSLLIEARAKKGKPNGGKLGFLNPMLYKVAAADSDDAFNDITSGTNVRCGADEGFPATKGWDAATGWGSLNYGKLKAVIENL